MADLKILQSMVRGRVHDMTPGYLKVIDTTIEGVWAYVAENYELPFLRAPGPVKITIPAGERILETNENVGRMLYVSSSQYGPKVMSYLKWKQFEATMNDDDSGDPSYFSDLGLKSNKKVIIVNITPAISTDYYLHYQERGVLGNLDKAPDGYNLALFHGVMSVIAPPEMKKFRDDPSYISWWKAVTHEEDRLFMEHLGRLVRQALMAAPDEPGVDMDSRNLSRLSEIEDIC